MKKELSVKDIVWYGSGGTDICDEWHWDGNYYAYIQNRYVDVKHNYEIKLYNHNPRKKKGEWRVVIYLCLNACNSDEVLILNEVCKGAQASRQRAVDSIKEYEKGLHFDEAVLPELKKKSSPVFAFIKEEWQLIGETLYYAFRDIGHCNADDRKQYRYYHPEMPNYYSMNCRTFCTLGMEGRIEKAELFSGGRSQSFYRDQERIEVLDKILPLIENDERYTEQYNSATAFLENNNG